MTAVTPKPFAALWPWQPLLTELAKSAEIFVVGGMVRDALRGVASDDVDIATSAAEPHVAHVVAQLRLKLVWRHVATEEITLRLWHPQRRSHLDLTLMASPDIVANLRRRDLSINAMALRWPIATPLTPIDPCGGQQDLAHHRLRLLPPVAATLSADPMRLLRLARFGCLGPPWRLARGLGREVTAAQINACAAMPAERRRAELQKALVSPAPGRLICFLQQFRALGILAPEPFCPSAHAWARARRGVERSARNAAAPWHWHLACLLLGLRWPTAAAPRAAPPWPLSAWLAALRLARSDARDIEEAAAAAATAPHRPHPAALARWLHAIRPAAWPLCCHLAAVADASRWQGGSRLGRAAMAAKELLGHQHLPTRAELAIDAKALIACGLAKSGPQLGVLLAHLWRFGVAHACWRDAALLLAEARRYSAKHGVKGRDAARG